MIGVASVILVVTISKTSQEYILEQIEGVGSNMVFAQYEVGSQETANQVDADFIKVSDVQAVRDQLADRIVALRAGDPSLPTISWGISPLGEAPVSADSVMDAADRAMYRHKTMARQRHPAREA